MKLAYLMKYKMHVLLVHFSLSGRTDDTASFNCSAACMYVYIYIVK